MSSFICSPKHFNSIEWNLRELFNFKDFNLPYDMQNRYKGIYSDSWQKKSPGAVNKCIREIVDELRKINVLAVSLQYKHHYVGVLDKEIETQTNILLSERNIKPVALTPHGLYNALNCLDYQIELCHIKELRQLSESEEMAMAFINACKNQLAHYIVSKLPEDINAWSL